MSMYSSCDEEKILVTRRMVQSGLFDEFRNIQLPDGEEPAANIVRINHSVLVSARYQQTIEVIGKNGYSTVTVKTTEIEKIDAIYPACLYAGFAAKLLWNR
ncbi:MAG: hypothetical protein WBB23_26155 [Desulforhopalus sp.]